MTASLSKFRSLYFAFGLTMGVFFPYIAILLQSDGLTSETIGILVSAGILCSMLVQPLWGLIADRYHSARLIIVLIFLVPAFFAAAFNLHSIGVLAVVTALLFIMKAPQASVANAYTLQAFDGTTPAFGRIRYFQSVGFGVGGYLVGFYLKRFHLPQLWLLFAVVSALAALLPLLLPPARARPAGSDLDTLKNLKKLFSLRQGHFVLFLLGALLINQTLAAFNTYLAVVFRDDGGSLANLGWAILASSAGNIASMTAAERLTKRFGTVNILLAASLLYVLRWGIQFLVTDPTWIIVIQLLHGSFGLFFIPAVRYVDSLSAPEFRATSQSIFTMVGGTMGLSAIVGNVLEGYLLHLGGPRAMYGVSAVSALAGTLCFAYITVHTRQRASSAVPR